MAPSRTSGSSRRRSPRRSGCRPPAPRRRRRSPAREGGAAARCGGSPSGSRAPSRDPRRTTTSPSTAYRRPSAVRGHARSPAAEASRIEDDETTRPSIVNRPTSSAVIPSGSAHLAERLHRTGRAMPEREVGAHPRVHRVQSTDQHVADEVLRRDLREPPRELEDDQRVDPTRRRSAMPSARRWSADRGSSPGVRISRGCRSNVTATLRASRSFAASTVRRMTSWWPRCTPSKNPTVTTDGPAGSGRA